MKAVKFLKIDHDVEIDQKDMDDSERKNKFT